MYWTRILRLPNLILVILAQYLVRFAVLRPAYGSISFDLSEVEFVVLVFVTLLVTVSGYLINDLYDYAIDTVNNPDGVYIGVHLAKRHVRTVYVASVVA